MAPSKPTVDYWPYARIAYDEPRGGEEMFCKCINFVPLQNDMDYAYWAEFEHVVLIAFRGTDTRGKSPGDMIKTWLSNMDCYPLRECIGAVKGGEVPERVLHREGILRDGQWGPGTIHDGFYTMWSMFKQAVDTLLVTTPFNKPCVTLGHSRGGPAAELCARHLVKNRGRAGVQCITYGSPGVGTKAYRDEFRALPIHATAVVNGYDLVTDMPPRVLGLRRGSHRSWLSQPLWHRYFRRIQNHLPESYAARLAKA